MLKHCEQEGKDNIVSWLPDGKAFKVHNSAAFVAEILPCHFKQTKYKSFQRQLNLWGFERITKGSTAEKGAYYHKDFLRDEPSLCKSLSRQNGKKPPESESKESLQSSNDPPSSKVPESKNPHVSIDKPGPLHSSATNISSTPAVEVQLPRVLDDYLKDRSFVQPQVSQPASFEGCQFFLLDMANGDDLIFSYNGNSTGSFVKNSLKHSDPRDPWEEIDIATELFSADKRNQSNSKVRMDLQLCAI